MLIYPSHLRVGLATLVAIGLFSSWNKTASADLIAHFDPNVTSTLFQDGGENAGGTIPVTAFGDPVGWITDAASPTPGWDGVAIDGFLDVQQIGDSAKSSYAYHPAGGILNFDGNDNLLGFEADTGARMDGVNGAFDSNTLQTVLVGRASTGGSGLGHFVDLRNAGAINGFGLRYNYATSSLEGVVRGETVVSAPVNSGEFFVANLVWDGANSTARLNVTTQTGSVANTGTPTDNTAIDHDRFRIGVTANASDGINGLIGDVYLYNDASDQSSLVTQLAGQYLVIPELIVNRDTGNVSITLPAGVSAITNVAGYTMTSAAGALNPSNWLSVADNYDASSPGPNQVDPDNNWTKLSNPTQRTDLSELEFQQNGGVNNGADFLAGRSTNLGNVWTKYYQEDIDMLLVMDDGSTQPLYTRFTGNGGAVFAFGDLDFDGDIDNNDFLNVFVANYGADTSALAGRAQMYGLGDLDENGAVELEDFLLLNAAYLAANPGAAALALPGAAVPEPSSLLLCAAALGAVVGRRRLGRALVCGLAFAMMAVFSPGAAHAAVGGVVDMDFQWLTPGSTISDGTRMQDLSGNRYHGFWSAAASDNTPVELAFPGSHTVLNNEVTAGYVILRDDLADTDPANPWWGVGNTPTPYFTLDADKSYTFEAVLNWNGNNQATDGIMGQTGGSEWWIRENNGFVEYVFDDGPNRNQNTGTIDISSLVDNSDWHHLGITFARDPVTPTQVTVTTYLDYNQVAQEVLANGLGAVGDPAADIRLGAYNTSAGSRFDGLMDHFRISDEVLSTGQFLALPAPPEYVLEVNTATGIVKIINQTGVDLTMDAYRLTSDNNSLNPAGWMSLDDANLTGQQPGSSWTELGTTSSELSEGIFGDFSVLGSPTIRTLGAAYANLGNEDASLRFEYHVPGGDGFNEMMVRFVDVTGGLPGDFNNDGSVDAADYTVYRDNLGASSAALNGNGTGGATVTTADYNLWKASVGSSAVAGVGGSAVPEPSAGLMALLFSVVGALTLLVKVRGTRARVAAPAALLLAMASAVGAATNDRQYRFGDPGTSDPLFGASVNNGSPMGFPFNGNDVTGDEIGPSGGFQDLIVSGTTYASVASRPGAGGNDYGARFNGSSSLATASSLNAPSQFWDNSTFFPNGEFPLNYEGIFGHGIQFWAQPDAAALTAGARQDLVIDTPEQGVYIASSGVWGLQFDGGGDSAVGVASTLNGSGWAHVMQLGGLADLQGGGSAFQGALYVNGVAVMVTDPGQAYDSNSTAMSVGSNGAGDGNFYTGVIDNLDLFLWGDNRDQLGADDAPGGINSPGGLNADGQDWGSFSLLQDNEFVAMQIASLGIGPLKAGDVNLDGSVNNGDVTAFLGFWQEENLVNGIAIGDWGTRQRGDLNLDGRSDIYDAILLRSEVTAAGGAFDFALLGQNPVPEPSTLALGAIIALLTATRRMRSGS
ncbi:hypothetical protein Pla175_38920 [Pirellulimonas nuda]|uniref:PEP-CTERM motif protein n=1 Tax=Pirellulimonas nuda TaxID=2528009 RepID=A0A518DG78_9BACT|nr:LamG-like jellyroll fold domain-containing protein [Pirellulimonas nuda]QDU90487.1 hypothetical protein Pla175_38920 [Pirellulimonas nuda]